MKKLISGFILGAVLASTVAVNADGSIQAQDASQVKFTFNGQQKALPDGYTAIMYQDHTYVPARFVAEQLGASVGWDDSTQTVSIQGSYSENQLQQRIDNQANTIQQMQSQVTQLQNQDHNDVATLKMYSKVADYYERLGSLTDMVKALSDEITTAYSMVNIDHNKSHIDDFNSTYLNGAINAYNAVISPINDIVNLAKNNGLDVSDMNTALQSCYDAIDKYKKATNDFYSWYNYKDDPDYYAIWNDSKNGFDTAMKGSYIALNGNRTYLNKIQNY